MLTYIRLVKRVTLGILCLIAFHYMFKSTTFNIGTSIELTDSLSGSILTGSHFPSLNFEERQEMMSDFMFWKHLKASVPRFATQTQKESLDMLKKFSFDKPLYNRTDFDALNYYSRLFSQLHYTQNIHLYHGDQNFKLLEQNVFVKNQLQKLERELYPWLPSSLTALLGEWSGKGIVMTTGEWHFDFCLLTIISIRKILKSELPIQVFYGGSTDLSVEKQNVLASIENVQLVDLTAQLNISKIQGWAIKPFAILSSKFAEIIFIDADSMFLQDPAILFESRIYKESDTVYFHDRSIPSASTSGLEFANSIIKRPSQVFKNTRFYHKKTVHELESGVVVLNKKSPALYALLTTCKLNDLVERDTVYKYFHGDKETFWIGHEVARINYRYMPVYGGTIGYELATDHDYVCGGLLHVDEKKEPLWWNGGIQVNKHHSRTNFLNFSHYAFDEIGSTSKWQWETKTSPFCLKPSAPNKEKFSLAANYLELLDKFLKLGKQLSNHKGSLTDLLKQFSK